MSLPKPVRTHLLTMAWVGLVCLVVHLPALRAPFIWDDFETVVQNRRMQEPGQLLRYFDLRHWRESHPVLRSPYRPARELILGAIRQAFGPDAKAFHAMNLAGHTVNALLVYVVALLLSGSRPAAVVGSLVFALHPSHVEVVAWTKNLGEIVCVLFALLSVAAFARLAQAIGQRVSGRAWAWAAACAACFALALLAKESALAVPLILAAWALARFRGRVLRLALAHAAILGLMACVYLALQLASQELAGRAEMAQWVVPSSPALRVFLVLKTVARYAGMLLFPIWHAPWHDFRLSGGEPWPQHAAVVAAVLGIGLAWLWAVRRRPDAALGLFWAMAAMGPASNIKVNAGRPLAEQRLYLPSVGFALAAAALLVPLMAARTRRAWANSLLAALCAVYGVLQLAGLNDWRSERDLWRRSVRFSPSHGGSYCNLGNAYTKFGAYEAAAAEYERVVSIKADYPGGLMNLGNVLRRMRRFDEALATLRRAEELFPGNAGVVNNVGNVQYQRSEWLRESGRAPEAARSLREAIASYERAATMEPDLPQSYANLGNCYLDLGEYAKAREMFQKALGLFPEFAEVFYNLGRLCLREGKLQEAGTCFRRAAELSPNIAGVFEQVALVHMELDELPQAEAAWVTAVRHAKALGEPPHELVRKLANLAMVREALGKPAAARAAWLEADSLAPGLPAIREGLARTAASGRGR